MVYVISVCNILRVIIAETHWHKCIMVAVCVCPLGGLIVGVVCPAALGMGRRVAVISVWLRITREASAWSFLGPERMFSGVLGPLGTPCGWVRVGAWSFYVWMVCVAEVVQRSGSCDVSQECSVGSDAK